MNVKRIARICMIVTISATLCNCGCKTFNLRGKTDTDLSAGAKSDRAQFWESAGENRKRSTRPSAIGSQAKDIEANLGIR
jgi:bifunctional pyridoxal-dependent enzyme with beta-cystathionase and maltose regulon repressor activities